MTEHVTLSHEELDRLQIMTRTAERRKWHQRHAGEPAGRAGERQIRRLYRVFKTHGAAGLVSARRGKPSQRQLPRETPLPGTRALIRSALRRLWAGFRTPGRSFRSTWAAIPDTYPGWVAEVCWHVRADAFDHYRRWMPGLDRGHGRRIAEGYFAVSVHEVSAGDARDEESRVISRQGKWEAGNPNPLRRLLHDGGDGSRLAFSPRERRPRPHAPRRRHGFRQDVVLPYSTVDIARGARSLVRELAGPRRIPWPGRVRTE